MPACRSLLVALRHEVAPRGRSPQPVVDGRAYVVELIRPRRPRRALDRLDPDAAHLGLDLAMPVGPDAAARSVAKLLRTIHRAGEPRRVQHALAAHTAAEHRLLHGRLDDGDDVRHAGTTARLRAIKSFASRTAV